VKKEGESVKIIVDVSPVFEDYSSSEIQFLVVSGILNIGEEEVEFGKRVPFRTEKTQRYAPEKESVTSLSLVIVLSLILVGVILVLFFRNPSLKRVLVRKRKVSRKKQVRKKTSSSKKKSRKKVKKRL